MGWYNSIQLRPRGGRHLSPGQVAKDKMTSRKPEGGVGDQYHLAAKTSGIFKRFLRTPHAHFSIITPYLKGIHLTLDGWCPHQDEEMWKYLGKDEEDAITSLTLEAPMQVQPAPRFSTDLDCLLQLFSSPHPPTRMIQCTTRLVAIYGFVDASTAGFGSSFALPDGSLFFRHGLWGRDADFASSNFRELCNLVDAIEEGVLSGELNSVELFVFTDNTTAKGCYYKG